MKPMCSVGECGREARYLSPEPACQMHYFRMRRRGHYGRTTYPLRRENKKGYQLLYQPAHPLAQKSGYVFEHRAVLFDDIGPGPMQCALCGAVLNWATCDVDHIDENPRNNARANLRPTCLRCNVWRSMPPAAKRMKAAVVLVFGGDAKTATEWARDPRVKLSGRQIAARKRSGMSDEQALFAPKKTHNSNQAREGRT